MDSRIFGLPVDTNNPEFQKIVKDMEAKCQAEYERVRKLIKEKGEL